MSGSDPVRFVIERDEIVSGNDHERTVFAPYDEPIRVSNAITFLRSRDPRGNDVFVFDKKPTLKGRDTDSFVRELAGDYASERPVTWVLSTKPDTLVQRATTQEYDGKHLEHHLQPQNVYAPARSSFFKPEQQWSRSDWKRFGPFEIHDIEVRGRERTIATPQYIRLSTLEEAMEARGELEFYFPEGPFGIESTIIAQLPSERRTHRRTGEPYTPRQIRRADKPHLTHRDGNRFKTVGLNAPRDTITPYLHKTS